MNIRVIRNGQEIPFSQLEQELTEIEQLSPGFAALVRNFLPKQEEAVQDVREELSTDVDLFKETENQELKREPVTIEDIKNCNDINCPICGETMLVDFAEALDAMKDGYRVTRKAWLDNDTPAYVYLVPEAEYPVRTDAAKYEFTDNVPYTAYFATRRSDGKVSPCSVFDAEELLATDWLIIDNESGTKWLE